MPKLFWQILSGVIGLTVLVGFLSLFAGKEISILAWSLLIVVWTIWVIASLQTIPPEQSALREWFGWLDEEHVLSPGLNFVPWFFGFITLRRISTRQRSLDYLKKLGTSFESRTKEVRIGEDGNVLPLNQQLKPLKAEVDAAVIWAPPWKDGKALGLLIRSGVPIDDDAKLTDWIYRIVANDIVDMVGKEPYPNVMGGKANNQLTKQLKIIIEESTHVFHRSGFFGTKIDNMTEGMGSFDFKIKFVHLPPNVSTAIDKAEEERWNLEAAEFKSKQEAVENMGAFVQSLVQAGYGTEDQVRTRLKGDAQVMELIQRLTLNDQVMKGGGTLLKLELPPGLGDLNNAIATGIALLKGLGGDGTTQNPSGGSDKPASSGPKVKTTPEQLAQWRKELAEEQRQK